MIETRYPFGIGDPLYGPSEDEQPKESSMGDETETDFHARRRATLGLPPPGTIARARAGDPSTSHAAAASIEMTALEETVYRQWRKHPNGATSVDIALELGVGRDSVSPRVKPLVAKGYLIDTDRRVRGPSGRRLIVWIAKIIQPPTT